MTVSAKPPIPGKDQFEAYCPNCPSWVSARCMIAFDPNARTLRYECDRCDYEYPVPHRLPKTPKQLPAGAAGDGFDDEDAGLLRHVLGGDDD